MYGELGQGQFTLLSQENWSEHLRLKARAHHKAQRSLEYPFANLYISNRFVPTRLLGDEGAHPEESGPLRSEVSASKLFLQVDVIDNPTKM